MVCICVLLLCVLFCRFTHYWKNWKKYRKENGNCENINSLSLKLKIVYFRTCKWIRYYSSQHKKIESDVAQLPSSKVLKLLVQFVNKNEVEVMQVILFGIISDDVDPRTKRIGEHSFKY